MNNDEVESSDSSSSSEEEEEAGELNGRKATTMASARLIRSSDSRGDGKVSTIRSTTPSWSSEEEGEEDDDEEDKENDEDEGSDDENEPQQVKRETEMAGSRKALSKAASSGLVSSNHKTVRASTTTSQSNSKRPADRLLVVDHKRKKKREDGEVEKITANGGTETEEKPSTTETPVDQKKLFQRVWEDEDETELLNTLLDYLHKEAGPLNDMNAFFKFSLKKLDKFKKTQLVDKVRRLKKKYEHNIQKQQKRGIPLIFKTAHEAEAFFISKQIWGEEANEVKEKDGQQKGMSVAHDRKSSQKGDRLAVKNGGNGSGGENLLKGEAKTPGGKDERPNAFVLKDKNRDGILKISEVDGVARSKEIGSTFWELDEVVERWMKLAQQSKVKDFEEKQKKLEGKLLEVRVESLELACERAKCALEAFKATKRKHGKQV